MNAAPGRSCTAFCLVLAAAACSGGSSGDVTGTFVDTYWLDSGAKVDVVPAGAAIRALVPDAPGAYKEYPGTVAASGSFVIPGVPKGTFFVEMRGGSMAPGLGEPTARTGLDAGRDVVGRSDVVAAVAPTTLQANVTGVDQWQTTDSMAILSSGANLALASGGSILPASATAGAADFGLIYRNLPQPADTVYVYQLRTTAVAAPASLRVATVAGSFTGQAVVDGGLTAVPVALSAAPPTGSLAVDWKTSQFEVYKAQMAPAGSTFIHELAVDVVPHSTEPMPALSSAATLLQLAVPDGTGDLALGSLSYGQFLPPLWKEARRARYWGYSWVTMPGATGMVGFVASVMVRDPQPASGAIVPRVSPPQNPTVNGLDALQPQTGVGLTPTLAWSAPALGTPTDYTLNFMSLKVVGTTIAVAPAYTMRVLGTKVTVPPGVLETGSTYVVFLTARIRPASVALAARRAALPDASGGAVLAKFTP